MNNNELVTRPLCPSGPTLFKGISDKEPLQLSWKELFVMVRDSQTVKHHTEIAIAARTAGNEGRYDRWKRMSGAITPSVCCEGGHAFKHVQSYTGYVSADFDAIPTEQAVRTAKARLSELPYVMMCWITASQRGLRVIVPYSLPAQEDGGLRTELATAQFKAVWRAVNEALGQVARIPFDANVNDPTRLSFISHDENVYYNEAATPFPIPVECLAAEQEEDEPPPTVPKRRGKDAGEEASHFVEQCFDQAVKMVEQREGQRYEEGNRNNYVVRFCFILNRMGMMFDKTLAYCHEHFGDLGYGELLSIVKSAYSHSEEFGLQRMEGQDDKRNKRQLIATREEVEAFLRQHYEVRKNEITNNVEWRFLGNDTYQDLHDYELNSIWRTISMHLNKQINTNHVWNTLNSDFSRQFNPLVDFLECGTRPWQEGRDPDYVAQLAAGVHTTALPDFFLSCLKKWMVGIVASIMSPMKNQSALVLVGAQGIGKTLWCGKLWPQTADLKRYYLCTTNTDFGNKDMRLAFTEFALICLDEIDQLNGRELNSLKSLMTAGSNQERAAYERIKVRRNHCASVCGTGNNRQFLTDATGNRRWLVFECTAIDDPVGLEVDYAGLYGQLYALWKSGYQYWFDSDETAVLAEYQSQFEVANPEKELIQRYFYKPDKTYYFTNAIGDKMPIVPVFMSTTEILKYISDSYRGLLNLSSVGRAMNTLGYLRYRRSNKWGYVVVPRNSNEIMVQGEIDALS